ncbi:nudix hydrolase 2-like isoform X2 [Mangifera indica]|uniref:nudix hydrolase 2-like isoform X2 n=1 Tax=Mangifera indica TaxID=29780 RepID=UPI001CFA4055|nr:nudix hydrolase 2-like isoform X2 [Mangifera indica]
MRDKSSCCRPLESLVEEAKCFIRFLRSLSLKFMWDKARSALIVFYPVYRQSILFSAPKFTFDRQASFTVYRQGFLFSAPKFTFDRQASFTGRRGSCFNLREMSTSSFHTIANAKQQQEIKLLEGINDNYGGVVIKMNEPMDPNNFASMLKSSMSCWKNQGKKGVWIELPIHLANLVEPAVKEGFWFHHAEQSYLMLANWIPGGAHTLPANASHRVGVGAFVFNEEKRELLVVQENSGRYRGKGIWKIPTGVVEQGEDICDAAEREVKEETSIEAKFVEVLAFRQSHKSFFGKSDLFFLCFMRPQTFDVKYQETELEAAKWMALEEYLKLPHVQDQEFTKYIIDLGLAKLEGSYNGFSPVPTISLFSDQKFNLYLNTVDLKHPKPASTGFQVQWYTYKTLLQI